MSLLKINHHYSTLLLFAFTLTLTSCNAATVQRDSREADAHYKLALSRMEEGSLQPAFVELQKTIRLNPGEKRAYYALGYIYSQFGDYKMAEESLMKATRIDPEYPEAYNSLGVLYTRTNQWGKAIKAFKRALKIPLYISPDTAYYNLGIAYYRTGDLDNAMKAFKGSVSRAPDLHLPYYWLALCYNLKERYGNASEALHNAIRLDPSLEGDLEKARARFTAFANKRLKNKVELDYGTLLKILHY